MHTFFEREFRQMNMRQKGEHLLGWHNARTQKLYYMTLLSVIKVIFALILILSLTSEALTDW